MALQVLVLQRGKALVDRKTQQEEQRCRGDKADEGQIAEQCTA
ncbi:hypothetical protein [Novosphingobium album (ex Hu et al. 2023)]|nr:hypothetical protein [Novosphingobium album (ex Hu et al. 2023)]